MMCEEKGKRQEYKLIFLNIRNLTMKVGLELSITLGTATGDDLINMVDRFVRFEPYMFTRKSKTQAWNERKHRKVIQTYNGDGFLAFSDRKWNSFSVGPTNKKHAYLSIRITQEVDVFFPTESDINRLLDLFPGLISAYLSNEEYVDIQSEIFSNNLDGRQLPNELLDSIRKTPYKAGVHGREYDVRFNPGRLILMDYSWLLAAWKMWLAQPFFVLVPKEKILAFRHAVEIKELPSGVVYVQLFERLEESHTVDSMFRQWKWQEWLDFDSLIKNQDSW